MIDKIRALAPNGAVEIRVSYYGSGDSFGEFNNVTVLDKDGNNMQYNTEPSMLKEDISDDDLWTILEQSEADFNNEGSEGEIVFDLVGGTIEVENFYIVEHREPGGSCTFKDPE